MDVERQKTKIPFAITKIEGVSPQMLDINRRAYLDPPVEACFESHLRALAKFIDSGAEFALILEDDFLVSSSLLSVDLNLAAKFDFDFLQIGFLRTTIFQSISILNKNLFDLFYKFGAILIRHGLSPRFLKTKQLFREQLGVPRKIVLNDIRPGAHAYVVSRKFALAMQDVKGPVFLSVDGLYIALGLIKIFKMGRLRKNLVKQSGSSSSILIR
jgi:GR25 family glycosyltransferase involved in LPS biosynthesis